MSRRFSSGRKRHGRNLLLSLAITLVAGHFLLNGGLASFKGLTRQRLEDPEFYVLAKALQHRLHADESIVFLGNSHFAYGIDSLAIEAQLVANGSPGQSRSVVCHSLGVFGVGPMEELVLLRRLIDLDLCPKTVVLEFWPFFLGNWLACEDASIWWYRGRASGAEIDRLTADGAFPRTPFGQRAFEWYTRRDTIRGVLLQWCAPELALRDYQRNFERDSGKTYVHPRNAWGTPEHPPYWDDWTPEYRRTMAESDREKKYDICQAIKLEGQAWSKFEEMISLCESHGIRLVVMRFPECSIWRSWYSDASRETIARRIGELRQRGIAFIDAWEWLDDDDFADGHHTRRAASQRFSTRLGQTLRPMLSNEPIGPFRLTSRRK